MPRWICIVMVAGAPDLKMSMRTAWLLLDDAPDAAGSDAVMLVAVMIHACAVHQLPSGLLLDEAEPYEWPMSLPGAPGSPASSVHCNGYLGVRALMVGSSECRMLLSISVLLMCARCQICW